MWIPCANTPTHIVEIPVGQEDDLTDFAERGILEDKASSVLTFDSIPFEARIYVDTVCEHASSSSRNPVWGSSMSLGSNSSILILEGL